MRGEESRQPPVCHRAGLLLKQDDPPAGGQLVPAGPVSPPQSTGQTGGGVVADHQTRYYHASQPCQFTFYILLTPFFVRDILVSNH